MVEGEVSSWRHVWKSESPPWDTSWAQLPGEYSRKGKLKGYSIDLSHADSGKGSAGGEGVDDSLEIEWEKELGLEKGAGHGKHVTQVEKGHKNKVSISSMYIGQLCVCVYT